MSCEHPVNVKFCTCFTTDCSGVYKNEGKVKRMGLTMQGEFLNGGGKTGLFNNAGPR